MLFIALCVISFSILQAQRNVVGLHGSGIAFGNYVLKYERTLLNKLSVVVNAGYLPGIGMPSKIAGDNENLQSQKIKGWSIMPEVRLYPGMKGSPRGFYLAPYCRIDKYSTKFIQSLDMNGTSQDFDVTGSLGQTQFGLAIGSQWLIKKRVSIDVAWFGFGWSMRNLKARFEGPAGTDYDLWAEKANE